MYQPSLVLVNMAGTVMATLFYGMYLVIFVTSLYLLFARAIGPPGAVKYTPVLGSVVFISGITLFVTVTGSWVITVVRAFQGFVYFQDGLGAAIYFNDNANVTETVGDIFLGLSLVIGDAMIIYRLWVVWSYNKLVVLLPSLSLSGLFISLVITIRATVHLQDLAMDTGLTPVTSFTIVTNVYCTAFLSWKVWRITRNCNPIGGSNLRNFMAVVVESAAIYTAVILYYTITHQLGSNLQYVAVGALPPVAAIANGLIHVRLGLGRTIEKIAGSPGSTLVSGPIRFKPGPSGPRSEDRDSGDGSKIKMRTFP
ncbi:hypothetical protein B0H15DRAFT_842085 [Mycena belliarum]|uniref:Uncharacterized protein n=1 Tax=Mycena belliarum TaxID=1033014 RepID=A0AAD6U2E9_9AGAR|nr:hypothetical protein B0H15DRAFT_842085 [Mycena belliae]